MYRKNQTTRFRSPLLEHQLNPERKDDSKCADEAPENQIINTVKFRSTSEVLNLFKKPQNSPPEEAVKENVTVEPNDDCLNKVKKGPAPVTTHNGKLMFNVVIGKQSARKHKKWDDDGILEVNGKNAVLKDSNNKVLHRSTVNPDSLVEGFRIYMNNKIVEIVERIHSDSIDARGTKLNKIIEEPPKKKHKSHENQFLPVGLRKGLAITENALVMPSLSSLENWLEESTFEKEVEVSVDACLANILRPHQRHGVVFLYECLMGMKTPNYYGAILADEMGLGKTLQCVTIIWTLLKKGPYGLPVVNRVLIVTPSSLCKNWDKEFLRWLGFHRISPFVVDGKNKPKDFKKQPRCSVMIISYDMLIRNQEEIEQLKFDLIVCDEGHRLKNNDIKAAKFLYSMACKRRILVTGTPIQNDLQEFYSLVEFVNPGILGTNHDYKINYEHPIVASRSPDASNDVIAIGKEKAEILHQLTKPFILRRTQETIDKYLPSKHEIVVICRLSRQQQDLYSLVTDTWSKTPGIAENGIPHLTVITLLKKICNHADLFTLSKKEFFQNDSIILNKIQRIKNTLDSNGMQKYCGKITVVQTLMKHLIGTNEKLVLISYYTQTLNLLETVCNAEGLKFIRLDGSTSTAARSKIVEQFNSATDDHKVFLLSGKAGGLGLNLSGASRLVLFDSDWNPASDAQAMARIWREGQKKDVYIYRLLTTGTIEEKIFQRQIAKTGLSETVVDVNPSDSLKFSLMELKDLFNLTTDTTCVTHDSMKCSCEGKGKTGESVEKAELEGDREYQFILQDTSPQPNITINQLLEWEHYKQPVPRDVLKEIMLTEMSDHVTFLFKNSKIR